MPTPLNPHSSVRVPRPGPARGPAWSCAALAAILVAAIAVPAAVAGAAPTKSPVTVTVSSTRKFTPTGVIVKTGETITISASGIINFGPTSIDHMTPAGRPRSSCRGSAGPDASFTAPRLDCWSLIGRIGGDSSFQVGSATRFRATSDGPLRLGVNDNEFVDNRGAWTATIAVAAASGGPTPPPVSGAKSSSDSKALLFVIAGLVVLLLLVAWFLLARRRRRKEEPAVAAATETPDITIPAEVAAVAALPAAVIVDEPMEQQLADDSIPSFGNAPGPLGTSVAPVEGEIVDVNIFEVEIANGTDLRVGYNYFPEDTNLHWQVRQGSLFAHGQFPTNGGGNMYHYVTLPLGLRLEPTPAAVDVQFTWAIGGVPFRYSVRRDPGL
jgi:LPXTG-motif cell wall-anchored protein